MNVRTVVWLTADSVIASRRRRVGRAGSCERIVRVDLAPSETCRPIDAEALAEAVLKATRRLDGPTGDVTLIIPIGWCYRGTIELPTGNRRPGARRFQLEEFLPIPLEEVTCAFVASDDTQVTGLAVETTPIRDLLEQLGRSGLVVDRIVPDVFCAAAADEANRPCGVMVRSGRRVSLGLFGDGASTPRLLRSFVVPKTDTLETLTRQVGFAEEASGIRTEVWHRFDTGSDADCGRLFTAAAENVRLPNLAVGALAQRGGRDRTLAAAVRTAAALALFLSASAVGLHVKRTTYSDVLRLAANEATRIFQQTLPGRPLPLDPQMRLASERLRLERLTHRDNRDGKAASPSHDRLSVLSVFRNLVAAFPAETRIDMLEVDIDDRQLALRGRTRDHRDAERIAEAINAAKGWTASPPRTSRSRDGGVEFSVRGTPMATQEKESTLADAG